MKYQGMQVYDCDVNESDWLDIRFSQEEKMDEGAKKLFAAESKPSKGLLSKIGDLFKAKESAQPEEDTADGKTDERFPNDESFERPYYKPEKNVKVKAAEASEADEHKPSEKFTSGTNFRRYGKIAAVVVMIVLLLVAMRYVDKGFAGDVFNYAKSTYTSTLSAEQTPYTLQIPATCVAEINDSGDIVFSQGKVVTSLEAGTVTNVTADSVTVKVNERLYMTYTGLSEVLVSEGETVSRYGALGRYEETAIVNLYVDQVKVTNITLQDYTLKWLV